MPGDINNGGAEYSRRLKRNRRKVQQKDMASQEEVDAFLDKEERALLNGGSRKKQKKSGERDKSFGAKAVGTGSNIMWGTNDGVIEIGSAPVQRSPEIYQQQAKYLVKSLEELLKSTKTKLAEIELRIKTYASFAPATYEKIRGGIAQDFTQKEMTWTSFAEKMGVDFKNVSQHLDQGHLKTFMDYQHVFWSYTYFEELELHLAKSINLPWLQSEGQSSRRDSGPVDNVNGGVVEASSFPVSASSNVYQEQAAGVIKFLAEVREEKENKIETIRQQLKVTAAGAPQAYAYLEFSFDRSFKSGGVVNFEKFVTKYGLEYKNVSQYLSYNGGAAKYDECLTFSRVLTKLERFVSCLNEPANKAFLEKELSTKKENLEASLPALIAGAKEKLELVKSGFDSYAATKPVTYGGLERDFKSSFVYGSKFGVELSQTARECLGFDLNDIGPYLSPQGVVMLREFKDLVKSHWYYQEFVRYLNDPLNFALLEAEPPERIIGTQASTQFQEEQAASQFQDVAVGIQAFPPVGALKGKLGVPNQGLIFEQVKGSDTQLPQADVGRQMPGPSYSGCP
jgi:hypothetical protein